MISFRSLRKLWCRNSNLKQMVLFLLRKMLFSVLHANNLNSKAYSTFSPLNVWKASKSTPFLPFDLHSYKTQPQASVPFHLQSLEIRSVIHGSVTVKFCSENWNQMATLLCQLKSVIQIYLTDKFVYLRGSGARSYSV